MPARPVAVFVHRAVPVPARSGGAIRAHRLMTGLAERFDVVLVALGHAPGLPSVALDAGEVARELPGIDVVTVPARPGRKRLQQLMTVPTRRSWNSGRFATPALRAAVHAVSRDRGAALVHFDGPGVGLVGPVPGRLNAVAPHDIDSDIERAAAERTTGPRRRFAQLELRKVLREERMQWRAADLCVAVSELDERAMRDNGAREVVVVANGTDPVPRLPIPRRAAGETLRLLFVGAPYLPNLQAVEWLVGAVLPAVRARIPVSLDVVGLSRKEVPAAAGVTAHGRVPSVAAFYAQAHVAVVPILAGSGSRLKVVEAMAHGVPVVSTTLGAAGLGLTAGTHYRAGDDPASFAEALTGVAQDLVDRQPGLERMLDAARAAAEALFWPSVAGRLATSYETALAQRHSAPPLGS
jgi:glycosyltransferase involved in cell wall biosynthesis